MNRAEALDTAKQHITVDRNATHGRAENSFQVIADFWTTYLENRPPGPLETHDVAALMILFKVARITASSTHLDNWIDAAGYSGIGAELSSPTEAVESPIKEMYDEMQAKKEE